MAASPTATGWSVQGRVCVVTGANSGIGKEVAADLARRGAEVVLACRSASKCAAAKEEIEAREGVTGTCKCMNLDLGSPDSIRAFATDLRKAYPPSKKEGGRVAVLVHNAGIMGVPPSGTEDVTQDEHFRINHLGTFMANEQLLASPSVMAPASRIVVVGSEAHRRATGSGALTINADGRIVGQPWNWYASYARSKLANLLFARELQRRLKDEGRATDVFTVSPGRVDTGIYENIRPFPLRWAIKAVSALLHQTPAQGAATVLYAACDPGLAGAGGAYLHDCKVAQSSEAGADAALGQSLWAATERLV